MTYNHGSMKHVALMYAKMVREPFTLDELLEFSKIFKDRDAARHSLNTCTKKKDLVKIGDTWKITQQGVRTVYQMPLARKKVKK